ncbi:hypothetical protein E4P29_22330 [Rhodococcus sp. 1R11]|uniref:hypothetical protein n=1 Tax=Rhodococcus sp. 1R11 TaxID=2559614 RepID=UPI001072A7C0|nr:hypothetical protein [Rhodococcus sp. 1R11]TFI40930.1 hypothetical protein E4P29_22330 [Rhodococcus sp. 1R11]
MHDTITGPRTVGLRTAIMAAIGQVPAQVKTHALGKLTEAYEAASRYVGATDYDHDRMEDLHEQVCSWEATAHRSGATTSEIRAAKTAGGVRAAAEQ